VVTVIGDGSAEYSTRALIDQITVITWIIFLVSMVMFYYFGKFTVKLIKQHQDVYSLLFELEEQEKERD
jgi:sensor domain CHASE-containing protein